MGKTVLIIGSETLLGRKLIELYLNSGCRVVAPVMTEQEKLKESEKKNLQVIPWNRSSLVSAKTVFREALRVHEKLDQTIVVNPELNDGSALEDADYERMDDLLGTYLHGNLYLIKEVLGCYDRQDAGLLAFAETPKGQNSPSLLPSIVGSAFHSMAESILCGESFQGLCCGFTSRLTEMEDYAQFIKGFLDAGDSRINGEWLLFSEKKNLFQSLPILKRK